MTAKILPHNRFPSKTMTRSVSRDINRPNTPQTDAQHQASQQAQRLPSAPRSPLDTSVLARLRLNGLITRIPDRNRYRLTSDGLAFAIFYTKVHHRLLRPLLAADGPPAPPSIRKALRTIDIHITQRIDNARLAPKAA